MIEKALKLIEERKFVELAQLLKEEKRGRYCSSPWRDRGNCAAPSSTAFFRRSSRRRPFVEMEPDRQELLIQSFSDRELREMLDELFFR